MTYRTLTNDTNKVISWSSIWLANDNNSINLCLDLIDGEPGKSTFIPVVKSKGDPDVNGNHLNTLGQDLIERTFLIKPNNNGIHFGTCVVKAIDKHDQDTLDDPKYKNLCVQ